jgi:hypothetical protein
MSGQESVPQGGEAPKAVPPQKFAVPPPKAVLVKSRSAPVEEEVKGQKVGGSKPIEGPTEDREA